MEHAPEVDVQPQKTEFYREHVAAGGRMVNFSGWLLPLEYTGILKETTATRTTCCLYDVSHMGRFTIRGPGAAGFLQRLVTNDVAAIEKGGVQYNLLLTPEGTVIDDLLVYYTGDEYRCVVNASNKEKVWAWMQEQRSGDLELIDETAETVLLSLQGPAAEKIMGALSGKESDGLAYMHVAEMRCAGVPCLVSRTGYTGEDGFEFSTLNSFAHSLWEKIIEEGTRHGLSPAGLGARDILRIEAGYPLYGHEIDQQTNPFDASLSWAVKYGKKDFIGKEKLEEYLSRGVEKKRIGFVMEDKGVPRQGYAVYDEAGKEIGHVTSGTFSPNRNAFIGMASVKKDQAAQGAAIRIKIRDKFLTGRVVALPLVPYRHK